MIEIFFKKIKVRKQPKENHDSRMNKQKRRIIIILVICMSVPWLRPNVRWSRSLRGMLLLLLFWKLLNSLQFCVLCFSYRPSNSFSFSQMWRILKIAIFAHVFFAKYTARRNKIIKSKVNLMNILAKQVFSSTSVVLLLLVLWLTCCASQRSRVGSYFRPRQKWLSK